ncbi:unnamed protein product [Lampetra planeri]
MAALIKKQILKHLSRFAKNLSPDKINVSTLKGEGHLSNLELDESVIQDVLDLPTWLAITRVFCNRAAVRIQWTKLKTHPISLFLDKVEVEMMTCEEPRRPNGPSPIATISGQSEYGFAEKVVEGMSLSVSSIVVHVRAQAFNASFQLSQLRVYSVNPNWEGSDLRFTRILDPNRGQVLTFKEAEWQTLRIEVDAIHSEEQEAAATPLRLITNQARLRIVLKRTLTDCNVISSKLTLLLDDLLWVLTDSQLKAVVKYAQSLAESIEKSTQQQKSLASHRVQTPANLSPGSQSNTQVSEQPDPKGYKEAISCFFERHDVKEPSYHSVIKRLDLHLCDDNLIIIVVLCIAVCEEPTKRRVPGGAMQLTIHRLTLDYYPYHRAGQPCEHWEHYNESTEARMKWASGLLEEFRSQVAQLKVAAGDAGTMPPKLCTTRSLSDFSISNDHKAEGVSRGMGASASAAQPSNTKLLSSCLVLRVEDIDVYQVSTADMRQGTPQKLLSCNKKALFLPPEMSAIHMEFTDYYFPEERQFPIPSSNLYVQLNALQFTMDARSILWMNRFMLDVNQSLEHFKALQGAEEVHPAEHIDIRVDGLMLKVVFPAEKVVEQPGRPHAISLQISDMVTTNVRHGLNCQRSDLKHILTRFQESNFYHGDFTSFPKSAESVHSVSPMFWRHAEGMDTKLYRIERDDVAADLTRDALKTHASGDVWAMHLSQFWVDYEGRGRPLGCVDSFPVTLWLCRPLLNSCDATKSAGVSAGGQVTAAARERGATERPRRRPEEDGSSPESGGGSSPGTEEGAGTFPQADLHVLMYSPAHVSAQISHLQYVFLLRLQQALLCLQEQVREDHQSMTGVPPQHGSVSLAVLVPSAEVALLLLPAPEPAPSSKGHTSESTSLSGSDISPGTGGFRSRGKSDADSGASGDRAGDRTFCDAPDLLCSPTPEEVDGGMSSETDPLHAHNSTSVHLASNSPSFGQSVEELATSQRLQTDIVNALTITKDKTKDAFIITKVALNSTMQKIGLSTSRESTGRQHMEPSMSMSKLSGECGEGMEEDSISVDSDGSDNFIVLHMDTPARGDKMLGGLTDGGGHLQSPAESADGALGRPSPEPSSSTSWNEGDPVRDLASVMLLHVQALECSVDALEGRSTVALQLRGVRCEQLGNVSAKQYLSARSASSGARSASGGTRGPGEPPQITLRLESRLADDSEALSLSAMSPATGPRNLPVPVRDLLQCHVRAVSASLSTSYLSNLGYFVEDELIPTEVLPLVLSVCDCSITIRDDGPSMNVASPGPVPVNVAISHVSIQRGPDGVFCISGGPGEGPSSSHACLLCTASDQSLGGHVGAQGAAARRLKEGRGNGKTDRDGETESGQGRPDETREAAGRRGHSAGDEDDEAENLKRRLAATNLALAEAKAEVESLRHELCRLRRESLGRPCS